MAFTRLAHSGYVFQSVFRSPDLRRLEIAFIGFNMAEDATWVAIIVFAYGVGGATAAGVVGLVQLVPAAICAPFASVVGDRYPRDRVMAAGYLAQATSMIATGVVLVAGAPFIVIFALATTAATAITLTRPVQAGILPSLSRTTEELTAANVVGGWIEGFSFFAGPLLAGLLLAISRPGTVFLVMGMLALGSAFAVGGVTRQSVPVHLNTPDGAPAVFRDFLLGIHSLVREPRARHVVSLMGVHFVLLGAIDIVLVVLAIRVLHIGSSGFGYLNAVFGIGGLLGSILTLSLIGRRRLALPLLAGVLAWGVGLATISIATVLPVVVLLIALAGAGKPLVDVTGRTLLQRVVPHQALSRVFGVVEGLSMASMGLGLLVTPGLYGLVGNTTAFVVLGLFFPAATLLSWRGLARIDATVEVPEAQIALLRGLPFFAPLTAPVVERLASRLIPMRDAAGTVIIHQGDHGDRFYIVVQGKASVSIPRGVLASLGPGAFFGEIALLRDIPRTATVTAETDVELYALERDDFLEAITGHQRSVELVSSISRDRLAEQEGVVSRPRG